MITCSAANLDIIEISASHNAGDACPSFTVTVKPHLGTTQPAAAHLAWTPPALVTFEIDGNSWECVPREAPVRLAANEVVYTVSYYPRLMHLLSRAKLKKPAVWVSAPQWETDIYLKDFDKDDYHIFIKDADVYASNGWTVADIFESLSALIGYKIAANFPAYHVSQKTVVCDENTAILDFIGSLLPSGFRFIWTMTVDGLLITLLAPSTTGAITLPPNCLSLEQQTPPVEAYDSVSITGAPYKLGTGFDLGSGGFGSKSSVDVPATVKETLPEETGELDGKQTRVTRSRRYQPDPYNTPFAVLTETETTYLDAKKDRIVVTTTAYDNQHAVLYETPRVIRTTRTISGYGATLLQGAVSAEGGVLMSDGYQLMTYDEYQAASPKPVILLSAIPRWMESLEVVTDEKTYITPETASKLWPEGTEKLNTQSTTCAGNLVNGRYFKGNVAPSVILQEVGGMLQQATTAAPLSVTTTTKTVDRVTRSLRVSGAGAYRFEETRHTLDPLTGALQTTTATLPVNSDPPSSPTRWRTAPLTATLGKTSATANIVFRAVGSVPTSNPADFKVWATRLFVDMTQPRKSYTVSVPSLIPTGALCMGRMVTGWSCSQRGNVFSASLTLE